MREYGSQISDEVRVIRKRLDLTQVELAALVGVDPQTVARWERGERKPGGEMYRRLQALQVGAGTSVPRGTFPGESKPEYQARAKRIEQFEREMIRLGADDFEADHVRERARGFIESIHSAGGTNVDEELETYLEYSLRPWVLKRIDQRRRRSEQQDAEDLGVDG